MTDALATKEVFLHDLKQILSLYRGYVELLAKPDLAPEKRAYYTGILQQNFNLLELMLGIGDSQSIDQFQGHINMGELLSHIASLFDQKARAMDKHIKITLADQAIQNWQSLLDDRVMLASLNRLINNLFENQRPNSKLNKFIR